MGKASLNVGVLSRLTSANISPRQADRAARLTKTGGKRHGSAMTTLATATLIALATGYPYEFPACSYLFADPARHPLPEDPLAELTGRIPVIACGSNRAPEQL